MLQQHSIQRYWKENLSLYLFVGVLFVMGVVFGSVLVSALSLEQKDQMGRYLSSFIYAMNDGVAWDGKQSFMDALIMNWKWAVLIWLLGLSVVGMPVVLILDFLKGVLVGFSVGFLVSDLSWKGVLFALVSVLPHNLIVIPAFMICSVAAVAFSVSLVKNRLHQRRSSLRVQLVQYTSIIFFMGILLTLAAFYQGYVSPSVMKWVTPMLEAL
jgi:stage II sporulation protein M